MMSIITKLYWTAAVFSSDNGKAEGQSHQGGRLERFAIAHRLKMNGNRYADFGSKWQQKTV